MNDVSSGSDLSKNKWRRSRPAAIFLALLLSTIFGAAVVACSAAVDRKVAPTTQAKTTVSTSTTARGSSPTTLTEPLQAGHGLPVATAADFPGLRAVINSVRRVIRLQGDGGPVGATIVKTTHGRWSPGTGVGRDDTWYGVQLTGDRAHAFVCVGRCQGLGSRSAPSRSAPTSRYIRLGFGPTSGGGDYEIGPAAIDMQQFGTVYALSLTP